MHTGNAVVYHSEVKPQPQPRFYVTCKNAHRIHALTIHINTGNAEVYHSEVKHQLLYVKRSVCGGFTLSPTRILSRIVVGRTLRKGQG